MSAPALKPPFSYYGGKTTLAPQIAKLLPAHDHYVEPFAGSLAVLLAKEPSPMETVNDLDGDLMTFWRALREQGQELERLCKHTPHSREEYYSSWQDLSDLPDIERARNVFVRLTQGRSHSMERHGWWYRKTSAGRSPANYIKSYTSRLSGVSERLSLVALESRDAVELAIEYGAEPSVCIYADPPYLGSTRERNYGIEMLEDDLHVQLADALNSCKASVVLSGYASPLYEELYEGWHRYELKAPTRLSGTAAPNEILWSNVPLGNQASLF